MRHIVYAVNNKTNWVDGRTYSPPTGLVLFLFSGYELLFVLAWFYWFSMCSPFCIFRASSPLTFCTLLRVIAARPRALRWQVDVVCALALALGTRTILCVLCSSLVRLAVSHGATEGRRRAARLVEACALPHPVGPPVCVCGSATPAS